MERPGLKTKIVKRNLQMHRGYVKVWRCINDTGMMKNHGLFAFWVQCLLAASHKNHTQYVGNQAVDLEPGEFIFGRHAWADKIGATEKELRVWLENLQKTRRIRATKRASKYTVYMIINWADYQQDSEEKGHEHGQDKGHDKGQQRASKGPQTRIKAFKHKRRRRYSGNSCRVCRVREGLSE